MAERNKVAVITGASRGIGFAIANELADLGYSLGITARSEKDIKAASENIRKKFPDIKIVTATFDVTDGAAAEEFIRSVNFRLGNISVLVNNAGYYKPGTSAMPFDEQQRLIDVNFLAGVRFVQAVLPQMKKSGQGYIFNIASVCGVEAFDDTGCYSASKFALVGYSSSLAQELAPMGIKVTALCPSWVDTQTACIAPMKPEQMIRPEDIALTVRYLLGLGPNVSIREIVMRC